MEKDKELIEAMIELDGVNDLAHESLFVMQSIVDMYNGLLPVLRKWHKEFEELEKNVKSLESDMSQLAENTYKSLSSFKSQADKKYKEDPQGTIPL